MMEHLRKVAARLALPFGDRVMTYNSRLAQELGKWAEQKGQGDRFHNAVFGAYFADGSNIAEPAVLENIAQAIGLPVSECREAIASRTFQAAVDADWRLARRLGVTAVPTFLLGGFRLIGAQDYEKLSAFLDSQNVFRH